MKPYILVVEDEPGIAELLRYNLEAAGHEVGIATDGDEALVSLSERLPDLLLLDWMLPGVSGVEVCRQLRRRRESRNLPVIMLTARG
ncbi:MAG: response regulator, partial [Alphaproteobacteria bacterium]